MYKTRSDNDIQKVGLSVNETLENEIIIEEDIPVYKPSGTPNSTENMEWGDLSVFGPILPHGTDVLRDKPVYRFFKRFCDLFLSVLALIVLFPFLLLVALLIFLDDPHGSPLFIQTRVGKNGKEFRLFKFRSMVVNAEAILEDLRRRGISFKAPNDPTYKVKDDPRITRFGKFIRKTSIDELPQLLNIILGHMSIVGPRPPLPREVKLYNEFTMQRLLMRPGLTCIWQSTHNRDDILFPEWMKMDVTYLHECSFLLDCKLIIKTFAVVFTANGN